MALDVGKRAGTMHVRVYPNTKKFPRELLTELKKIEKSMPPLQVEVSKAKVHSERIKRSIQAQLGRLRDLEIAVKPVVDKGALAKQLGRMHDLSVKVRAFVDKDQVTESLSKTAKDTAERSKTTIEVPVIPTMEDLSMQRVKRSIEESMRRIEPTISVGVDGDDMRAQLNKLANEFQNLQEDLDIKVLTNEEAAAIRHRIAAIDDELDKMAKDRTVRVDVNPFTSWASARLAWLPRPRVVEIIPKVSQAALAKAFASLAALSGARLSYDYLKRFSDWISEVDKKLPRLTFSTLGLTTAFSGLMGALSGIVGIGDGLAATLPSLLLLPGLLAGAAMSGVTLFVALKDAKDELAELGDSYTNLGAIIKDSFWSEARQPIIDFSNSIMPQLERSFDKTALAIGRFTAKLAGSFQAEFAGGRLEAMFDGLADSWDELSKGTDAFAGAITNLGLVAARYMPRLARWFVRQADTFDNWLSQVATDGRLDQWIEEAIDSFYALWDVARATTGIFRGLWKAAEAAGSKGLRGFADMLLRWDKAVNGLRWQETLTSMFRGARVALDGFGDGLERVGRMLHTQRETIEYFMGTAGKALGDFMGDLADAFSRPEIARGLTDLVDGLKGALEGLKPALEPLSGFLGELLGFIGDLGRNLGEVLGKLGEQVLPELEKIFERVRPKLDELGSSFKEALDGVNWESLGDQVADLLEKVTDLATELVPLLGEVANFAIDSGFLQSIADAVEDTGVLAKNLNDIVDLLNGSELEDDAFSDGSGAFAALKDSLKWLGPAGLLIKFVYDRLMELEGVPEILDAAWGEFPNIFEGATQSLENFKATTGNALEQIKDTFFTKPLEAMTGMLDGFVLGFATVAVWLSQIPSNVQSFFTGSGSWLPPHGSQAMTGWRDGLTVGYATVASWLASIPGRVTSFFSGAGSWLVTSGAALLQGFADGVTSMIGTVVETVSSAVQAIRDLFPFSPAKAGPFSGRGWVSYSGQSLGETFGKSIVASLTQARRSVAKSLGGIRSEFASLSQEVNSASPTYNVAGQFASDRAYSVRMRGAGVNSATSAAGNTLIANFTQPEQREQLRELESVFTRLVRK